jgi:hypothetical protein
MKFCLLKEQSLKKKSGPADLDMCLEKTNKCKQAAGLEGSASPLWGASRADPTFFTPSCFPSQLKDLTLLLVSVSSCCVTSHPELSCFLIFPESAGKLGGSVGLDQAWLILACFCLEVSYGSPRGLAVQEG